MLHLNLANLSQGDTITPGSDQVSSNLSIFFHPNDAWKEAVADHVIRADCCPASGLYLDEQPWMRVWLPSLWRWASRLPILEDIPRRLIDRLPIYIAIWPGIDRLLKLELHSVSGDSRHFYWLVSEF